MKTKGRKNATSYLLVVSVFLKHVPSMKPSQVCFFLRMPQFVWLLGRSGEACVPKLHVHFKYILTNVDNESRCSLPQAFFIQINTKSRCSSKHNNKGIYYLPLAFFYKLIQKIKITLCFLQNSTSDLPGNQKTNGKRKNVPDSATLTLHALKTENSPYT